MIPLGSYAAMQLEPALDPPDDYPTDEDGEPLSWEALDRQNAQDYADMVSAQEAFYA